MFAESRRREDGEIKGGLYINSIFTDTAQIKKTLNDDGTLLLICTASIFLPFYLCAVPLLFTFIHFLRKQNGFKAFIPPHAAWFYAFAALGIAVGTIYSHWQGIIVFELLILLFLFGFYAQSIMTEKIRCDMFTVVSIGSIATAAVAIIQRILNMPLRSTSFFYNANYYAYVCEIVIVALIYAVYRYGSKPVFLAAIFADFAGILASGCRTAWLAVFFGVLILMICLKKYRHMLILIGIGAVIAIGIYFLPQIIFPRYVNFHSDKSLRLLIWKTTIGYIKQHFVFGQGMFTYFLLSKGRAHDTHAHNLLLDLLVNFGVVGTGLITTFLVLMVRDLVKGLRKNMPYAIALGVIAASFVHGVTDVPFIGLQSGGMFVLMFSLAGLYSHKPENIEA